nr:alginate lyase family protein [uncultured Pedobacter sp.]
MKYLSIILLSLFSLTTHAQYLSMNKQEVKALKKLIKKDAFVQSQYLAFKKLADSSLSEKPAPVDTVFSEGRLANDPKKIRSLKSLKDVNRMYALVLSYKIEGKKVYLSKAKDFLLAWATLNKPMQNPINDTKFEVAFEAYDLIKNDLKKSDNETIKKWLSIMAYKELNHPFFSKLKPGHQTSNWNSHRVKVIGMIAYAINDDSLKEFTISALPSQIGTNLYADGSGMDFKERDALHYQVYTLEPLVRLAIVVNRATAVDYYHYVSPIGSSIQKSMEFLVPYTTGEKTHEEFVNSKIAFDKKRAQNKESNFITGAFYQPSHGLDLFSMATYFEPEYLKIVRDLEKKELLCPNWRVVMNHLYGRF